ncbi:MAG TPA: PqiC family protein [Candidatus Acidoferrum sp.]|nr:PqiC family protein [Candidatus Acidoferrum sp.]
MTRLLLKTGVAGAIALALAGCSYIAKAILAPQKDVSRFYLLTPTAADSAASTPATVQGKTGDYAIGLGPIKLPPYLDRPEVVTLAAPNRLELSKEDRWGESVQNGFTSAMERDLSAQTGGSVILFPWYSTVHIDLQVQIDVYRFETDAQGIAHLSAKWTIIDPASKNVLYTVESNLTQPSKPGDFTDGAAALSRTIGDLSGQIANMIHQLRSQQGAHPA